jgi:glutamate racemase
VPDAVALSDSRPVGVFDSGVGGLSILREIHRQLPSESVVYLADQAWAPYGERRLDEVRARSFAIVDHLLARGVKGVVVACNTASAAALHELRRGFPSVPFIGMEPAVKPAAEQTDRGVVGVLATSATFQGELYASVVDRHANGVGLVERAGTGLVELIEDGVLSGPVIDAALHAHLAPMLDADIDTLVLGCTHYPFVADRIRQILGDEVQLIDPAPAVARQLGRVLAGNELAAGPGPPATTYLTTGHPEHLDDQIELLLRTAGAGARHATL